jgi:hypothetical protein
MALVVMRRYITNLNHLRVQEMIANAQPQQAQEGAPVDPQ